jgi:hypothetical protein
MNRKILMVLAVSLITAGTAVRGQVSFTGEEMTSLLNNGYEMFEKAKYAAAVSLFDKWLEKRKRGTSFSELMLNIMLHWHR